MKIKVRVCPNNCRALVQLPTGKKVLVRMAVVPKKIPRQRSSSTCDGVDYSMAWILDYVCPVCGYSRPITADDMMRKTRNPKYNAACSDRVKDRKAAKEGHPRWTEEEKTRMIKDPDEWERRSICNRCALKHTCSHSSIEHVGHIVQSCDKFVLAEKKTNE